MSARRSGIARLVVGNERGGSARIAAPLKRLEEGGRAITRAAEGPVALLFGSERFGLSNVEMSHCHWMMRIPTREEHGSMNLGQAVAVCLYELIRGRKMSRQSLPLPDVRSRRKKVARQVRGDRASDAGDAGSSAHQRIRETAGSRRRRKIAAPDPAHGIERQRRGGSARNAASGGVEARYPT